MDTPTEQQATVQDESTQDLQDMQAVFDEEEELDETPRSIFKDIAKQILSGMDLTRVAMPAFISEPHSFIETTANLFSHISFFREALSAKDPVDRIALLTRFYISGFHIRPRGVKKPYNPILGEVFRCFWDHEDGSRTWYVAEQVSHHPPISAFYFENLESGYTIEGQIQIRANFTGNSAGTFMMGTIFVHFLKLRETYTITYPVWYARNVLMGTMRMETCGKTKITCLQTGLAAAVDFKVKPMGRGKYNQIEADIYRLPEGPKPMAPISEKPEPAPFVTPTQEPAAQQKGGGWFGWLAGKGAKAPEAAPHEVLIHIWGDWTSVLYATDNRLPATLTTPYTPEMLKEAAVIQWRVAHKMAPYDPSSSDPLPTLTPLAVPADAPANTVLFFDVHCSPYISKRCLNTAVQKPFESRVVWKTLTEKMNERDYDAARLAKIEVEERQRGVLKERTKIRKGFRQRFFHFDPFPRTVEEAQAYPHGRYRMNYSIDCTSSAVEIDPSKRLFSCFNLPDMNELMRTWPILTEELVRKDEDAQSTDFLSIDQAADALRERKKGTAVDNTPGRQQPSTTQYVHPKDIDALIAEGVFGPRWPMDSATNPVPTSSDSE